MAIAFETSAGTQLTGSGSFNINCSGSDRYLIIATNPNVTAISHNGTSLSVVHTYTPTFPSGTNCPPIKIWGLRNPDTGVQSISVTIPSGASFVCAVNYTGVAPGTIEAFYDEDSANNQVSSFSGTVSTITPNAWRLMIVRGANSTADFTAGSSTSKRVSQNGVLDGTLGIFDSNSAITTPGSGSLNMNWASGSGFITTVTMSLSPVFITRGSCIQYL